MMRTADPPATRRWIAFGLTGFVLVSTGAMALLAGPSARGPIPFVESVSAAVSGAMLTITAHFPRGYAFVAGMITAVNPCGFALLPAYLGLYLNEESGSMPQTGHPIGRALIVSATVAFSFVILFGIFGLLVNSASTAITPFLPWIGTGVGVALILAGGFLAAGGEMPARFPLSAADRLGGLSRRGGVISFAAFGAGYGLASLGCALPIFLSVVATSLQARGLWSGVSQFVLFGLGMGSVLALLTIATASFGGGLLRGLRTSGKYFATLSAGLLWLAGAYVLFYWLTIGRLV